MPSHRIHKAVSKAILGKDWEIVNLIKDAPYRLWPGKEHRKYFHDDETNLFLGILLGPEAMLAGMLHDWMDNNFIEVNGVLIPRERHKPKRKKKRTMFKLPSGKKRKK